MALNHRQLGGRWQGGLAAGDSLVAPASISIDTAAGPAVNPGGVCAESHRVAPGLRRDGGTLMSPGLLTASGTGRWLRLSHCRFRGSAPQSN